MKRQNRKPNQVITPETLEVRSLLSATALPVANLTVETGMDDMPVKKEVELKEADTDLLKQIAGDDQQQQDFEAEATSRKIPASADIIEDTTKTNSISEADLPVVLVAEEAELVFETKSGDELVVQLSSGDVILPAAESTFAVLTNDGRVVIADVLSGNVTAFDVSTREPVLPNDRVSPDRTSSQKQTKADSDKNRSAETDSDAKQDKESDKGQETEGDDESAQLPWTYILAEVVGDHLIAYLKVARFTAVGIGHLGHGPFMFVSTRAEVETWGTVVTLPVPESNQIPLAEHETSIVQNLHMHVMRGFFDTAILLVEHALVKNSQAHVQIEFPEAENNDQSDEGTPESTDNEQVNEDRSPDVANGARSAGGLLNNYVFDMDSNPFTMGDSKSENQGEDESEDSELPTRTTMQPADQQDEKPRSDAEQEPGEEEEHSTDSGRNPDGTPRTDESESADQDLGRDGDEDEEDEDGEDGSSEDMSGGSRDPSAAQPGNIDDPNDGTEGGQRVPGFILGDGGVICPMDGEEHKGGPKVLPNGVSPTKGDIDPAPDDDADGGQLPSEIGGTPTVQPSTGEGWTCPRDDNYGATDELWVMNDFVADIILNGPGGGTAPVSNG